MMKWTIANVVVLCFAVSGVSAFSTASRTNRMFPVPPTSFSFVAPRVSFCTKAGFSNPLHMAFIGGEDPRNDMVPLVPFEFPSESLTNDVQAIAASLVAPAESEYAVEQTRSTTLPWWDQPSVLVGRGLALLAAAIYGTNFAAVKILNDSLPVSLAASLRFGIGAAAFAISVALSERKRDRKEEGEQYFQVYDAGEDVIPVSKAELHKERTDAMWAGGEVGLCYSLGYIAQAIAFQMGVASYHRATILSHRTQSQAIH